MKQPRWLLEQTIVAVHSVVLEEHGGAPGVRDEDMLASALNRPVDKYNYEPDCTIFELAAAYSFGLAKNCLLYTSPSPRDQRGSRMPSSA